jgi:hypothetical protein
LRLIRSCWVARQFPNHIQTWLLYHNALSTGVVIEDILKYARTSKEAAETVAGESTSSFRASAKSWNGMFKRVR